MQDQSSSGSSKHAHEFARPLRDSDLEFVKAVGMPVGSAKQKRLRGELDQRFGEPTAELAEANDEIRTEIIESRNVKAHLLESEAALHSSLLFAADRPERNSQTPSQLPNKCWAEFRQLAKLRQTRLG